MYRSYQEIFNQLQFSEVAPENIECSLPQSHNHSSVNSNSMSLNNQAEALCEAWHATGLFAGIVQVSHQGQVVFEGAYGEARPGEPFHTMTPMPWGSITKSVIGLVTLQMATERHFKLDDLLASLMPELPLPDGAESISVLHLLQHTAALAHYDRIRTPPHIQTQPISLPALWERVVPLSVLSKPGTRFEYCNTNYLLLRMLIESIDGCSFAQSAQQRVFKPAQMTSVSMNHDNLTSRAYCMKPGSAPHAKPEEGIERHLSHYAAGDIVAPIGDALRYAEALMDRRLEASQHLFDLLAVPGMSAQMPDGGRYLAGWIVDERYGRRRMHHPGSLSSGYRARLTCFDEEKTAWAALSNLSTAPIRRWPDVLMADDLDALSLQRPTSLPAPRHCISVAPAELMNLAGVYVTRPERGEAFHVEWRDSQLMLWISLPDGRRTPARTLLAVGDDEFVLVMLSTRFLFRRSSDGHGDALMLRHGNVQLSASRIAQK